jgi:hypothetical protein
VFSEAFLRNGVKAFGNSLFFSVFAGNSASPGSPRTDSIHGGGDGENSRRKSR